ncbi:MAG: alpha/beta hydrolase [Pseudomonadota bacterium]
MSPNYIDGPNGKLAIEKIDGTGPTVIWLGGFRSDMTGTKAGYLADWAKARGQAFLRFDYSGHGASAGEFEKGCISDWAADARHAIETLTEGPVIPVGSSMGGWVSCLLIPHLKARLAGLVFIAPAPDFTSELMWPSFSEEVQKTILEQGFIDEPSEYDEAPTRITQKLIEDGAQNKVLNRPIEVEAPVRVLQGMADPDVPWEHAIRLVETLTSSDIQILMTKSGDHRLSSPEDLARLGAVLDELT